MKQRLILAARLRWSSRFSWNAISPEGRIQLNASINFLAENFSMGILHNFAYNNLLEERDDLAVEKMTKKINNYPDYREYETSVFPDDWV